MITLIFIGIILTAIYFFALANAPRRKNTNELEQKIKELVVNEKIKSVKKIASNMKASGFGNDVIAKVTELPIEEVENL